MTIEEVENRFGTLTAACVLLNLVKQNATKWRKIGYIPLKQQFRIAILTNGELMPDDVDPSPPRKRNLITN